MSVICVSNQRVAVYYIYNMPSLIRIVSLGLVMPHTWPTSLSEVSQANQHTY